MPYKDPSVQREYQRVWMAKRRSDYLKDKACVACGSKERLEVDHKDPSKKWSHRIWSYCATKREKELRKCQILCNPCHLKKTANDVRTMRQKAHGTLKGYTNYHCRCDKCMKFMADSPDEYSAGISLDLAKELVLV